MEILDQIKEWLNPDSRRRLQPFLLLCVAAVLFIDLIFRADGITPEKVKTILAVLCALVVAMFLVSWFLSGNPLKEAVVVVCAFIGLSLYFGGYEYIKGFLDAEDILYLSVDYFVGALAIACLSWYIIEEYQKIK